MIMSELWDQISDIADLNKVRINFNLTLWFTNEHT